MRRSLIAAFAVLLAVTSSSTQLTTLAQQGQQGSASQSAANGLNTVTFELAAGKIKVYLPDDMRAGDTISGTVSAEPRGSTDAERTANQGVLNGMVIDLGGEKRFSAGERSFKWSIPIGKVKRQIKVFSGLGSQKPLDAQNLALSTMSQAVPADFALPQLGQAGRPLTINGPFDGNASNTTCMIGGQPAEFIAESPRQAIITSPTDVNGPTQMSVAENGQNRTGPFRNIGVSLTSPKTNLLRGEKTTLSVQVSGLEGIQSNVPLQIVATGSANMSGGNTQTIEIRPVDISSAGNFTRAFELTGVQTGGFTVTGTILVGNTVAAGSCKCVCELAKTPIVTAGTSNIDGGGMQHAFKANVAKAACNGNKCSIEKTEYSWSIAATSTATYTVAGAKKDGETLKLDVTGAGTVVVTVTVTITCSDGTKCSASGSKTFTVKAK
ncbi:MAG: hypothetical protein WBD16_10940 [Pyrinomonadaceae bacterium]